MVTGGGRGIGASVARRLVAEGAKVVVGDLDVGQAGELEAELGDAAVLVRCDVTVEEDVEALAEAAHESFGGLDIVVANAGGGISSTIAEHSLADWRSVVDLTLTGAFLTVRTAARHVADGGAVVAIASLNAVQPARGMAAYCAAKAGVVALVDVAALELGPRGVRVNAVAPGLVRTPATELLWGAPALVEAYEDNTALGRHAHPDDIHRRRRRLSGVRRCRLRHRHHPDGRRRRPPPQLPRPEEDPRGRRLTCARPFSARER